MKERRLQWYGRLLRLPDNTPAKITLREAQAHAKKLTGGQRWTWITMNEKDLETAKDDGCRGLEESLSRLMTA